MKRRVPIRSQPGGLNGRSRPETACRRGRNSGGSHETEWTRLRACPGKMLHCGSGKWVWMLIGILMVTGGCRRTVRPSPWELPESMVTEDVTVVGYSIQAGAFAIMDNAVQLTDTLRGRGLEAVYFVDADKLYKVRFGDFPDWASAERYAEDVKNRGIIGEFFIVQPQVEPVREPHRRIRGIRRSLVIDAQRFIGTPYRWGGAQPGGFDCSGLVMTVYRLNGIVLPRTSAEQFEHGHSISRRRLKPGDLVFFRTAGNRRISHVGIYIGDGCFIHAPGRGRHVQEASLSDKFYKKTYAGARTYLR
jgi:hypothetical protein